MGEFIDKLKGKAKQAMGKMTGNRKLQSEGLADRAKGEVKGRFEEAKTDLKRAVRRNDRPTSPPPPHASNR